MSLLRVVTPGKGKQVEDDISFALREIKAFFSWAARHPQLMGVALILAGYLVKRTRTIGPQQVWVPGNPALRGIQGPFDAAHPDPSLGHFETKLVPTEGMDFSLVALHAKIPGVDLLKPFKESILGSWLYQNIPAIKDAIDSGAGKTSPADITFDITFGDLLIAGGALALVGPAISGPVQNLLSKV